MCAQAFQSELESRRDMVENMRANETPEMEGGVASQLEELGHVWDRVNTLSNIRESRLADAVKLVSFATKSIWKPW